MSAGDTCYTAFIMNQVTLDTIKSLKKTAVLFDEEGKPVVALIPLQKQFSKLLNVTQILKDSSQTFKLRGISQEDLLAELSSVREELYQKYYGKKTKGPA